MARENMRDLAIATINLLNLHLPGGITYDSDEPEIPDTTEGKAFYKKRVA